MINKKHDPDKGENGLHYPEQAGCQEARIGSRYSEALEDGGRVVVDRIDTRS